MTGILRIICASDIPAMAVDVVAPDLQVVKRLFLAPGVEESVEVPSNESFLRAHLPSGETLLLREQGSLDRVVDRASLREAQRRQGVELLPRNTGEAVNAFRRGVVGRRLPPQIDLDVRETTRSFFSLQAVRAHHRLKSAGQPFPNDRQGYGLPPVEHYPYPWSGDGNAKPVILGQSDNDGGAEATRVESDGDLVWMRQRAPMKQPLWLQFPNAAGYLVRVCVPDNTLRVRMRRDSIAPGRAIYSVRLQSHEPVVDTILNYLARGELDAADAMRQWAELSETLLLEKRRDPYAAAVGAYLLLRFRDFERMHDWPRNLADWFAFLPDGNVIRAWQCILTGRDSEEVEPRLLRAVEQGAPAYTEGTRLLQDGLKLMGERGRLPLRELQRRLGALVPGSPVTAAVTGGADPVATLGTFMPGPFMPGSLVPRGVRAGGDYLATDELDEFAIYDISFGVAE